MGATVIISVNKREGERAIGQSIVFLLYMGNLTKRFRFGIMLKNGGGALFG